ncbi:MAG TPA: transposase [Verrucomicrobiae bacterium]|nr:transposase [Verrucomicrobiae bacterium]
MKVYGPQHVYHVYNRGNNKELVFRVSEDYAVFLNILKRYLGEKQENDSLGRLYKNFSSEIELVAFCLMPNHYHLLLYQETADGITKLMKSITASYTGYFNKKYEHVGHVFQGTFKASLIDQESYWQHISRYIHLNPRQWRNWRWSSLPYYLGEKQSDWVKPERLLGVFEGHDYLSFVSDHEDHKAMLDELKTMLAN